MKIRKNRKKKSHISTSTRRGRKARRITAGFKESTLEILKAVRNGNYA